jgi:hypothetical protein
MVTVAEHVLAFPLPSVAVKTTVFGPAFAQVNVLGASVNVGGVLQASVLPLFTAVGGTTIVAAGATVKLVFRHFAIGFVKSLTVTVALQVLELPAELVTVSTTMFGPRFEQLKVDLLKLKFSPFPEQTSVLPLLIPAVVIEPLPAALNITTAFLHLATGGWL